MKAPTIITSMARALGIVATTEEVAIVPLEQWHRVFERVRAAEARVQELEAASTAQQMVTVTRPGVYLMSASRVIVEGKSLSRFSVTQVDEVQP